MQDDDDDADRPDAEDLRAPELGPPGPPRPSTDEADYSPEERAAWAAHDDEVELQVRWKEGGDDVKVYEAHLEQCVETGLDPPPRTKRRFSR